MTVLEALLQLTSRKSLTKSQSERLSCSKTKKRPRYELYRRIKRLYGTRSNLVHGSVENKKGLITYDKLRLDPKWTIVPDQEYFDLFDYASRAEKPKN